MRSDGLRDVERSGRDEEDVVRPDRPVLRLDGRPLDEREEVALNALARDVGAAAGPLAAGDLVDLVEEDDAGLLGAADRLRGERRLVGERVGLPFDEDRPRLRNGQAHLLLLRPAEEAREHPGKVDPHLLDPLRAS